MPAYTIDGKEVSQEEMKQHIHRESVRKHLLCAADHANGLTFRDIPLTHLGANELLGVCVELLEARTRLF